MITLYAADAVDYGTNGLLVLDKWCAEASISEKLNGEYRLHMELVINSRTVGIAPEMVIKTPAPVRFTPQLNIYEAAPTEVYKVVTDGRRLTLRIRPEADGKALGYYSPGTEVIVTDTTSEKNWYAVAAPDGKSGWMWAGNLVYVRTDNAAPVSTGVIEQKKTRDQLFRVQSVKRTLDSIQIEALHISYDLRRNYVPQVSVVGKTGAQAFETVLSSAAAAHEFTAHSDITALISEDVSRRSPIAAILSDGGLIEQAGGELLRDNFDLYWTERIGMNRGVSIAYRKNMAGMDVTIDTADLVTRIIPVGFDKKGNPIIGDPVDSPYIDRYVQPYIAEYEYKDVKIGSSGIKSESDVRAEIARRAALEFEGGIDTPKISVTVDFIDLQETDFAREFEAFNGVFLGDTVSIRHEDYGMDLAAQMVAYEWDCLRNEYIGISMGSRQAHLSEMRISPSQIGNGTLNARKLTAGTVGSVELGEGVVTNDHVSSEGIDGEKIYGSVSGVDTKNGIIINESGVYVTGREVEISTGEDEEDEYIYLTSSGITSSSLNAPNVSPRYAGSLMMTVDQNATPKAGVYRSLSDAFAALNGRQIEGDVVINCIEGTVMYVNAEMRGVCGGTVTINGSSTTLYGTLRITQCSSRIQINKITVAAAVGNALTVSGSMYVGLWGCTVGSDNGHAVFAEEGTRLYAEGCTLISAAGSAAFITTAAFGVFVDCIGTGALAVQFASLAAMGTVPDGGCENRGCSLINAEDVVPTGADGEPTMPETMTKSYPMVHSDSYRGGWNWYEDNDIRQGYITSGRIRGCVWFDNDLIRNELAGWVINQATLRLYAMKGVGRGVAVSVELYGTTSEYDSRTSSAPALTTSYGTIGSVTPGEVTTITIPTQAVNDLVNGTINALVVYSSDTELHGEKSYSRNYARFAGETSGTADTIPVLTVVAEGSASTPEVTLTVNDDGNAVISGTTVTVDADGNATISGATIADDGAMTIE